MNKNLVLSLIVGLFIFSSMGFALNQDFRLNNHYNNVTACDEGYTVNVKNTIDIGNIYSIMRIGAIEYPSLTPLFFYETNAIYDFSLNNSFIMETDYNFSSVYTEIEYSHPDITEVRKIAFDDQFNRIDNVSDNKWGILENSDMNGYGTDWYGETMAICYGLNDMLYYENCQGWVEIYASPLVNYSVQIKGRCNYTLGEVFQHDLDVAWDWTDCDGNYSDEFYHIGYIETDATGMFEVGIRAGILFINGTATNGSLGMVDGVRLVRADYLDNFYEADFDFGTGSGTGVYTIVGAVSFDTETLDGSEIDGVLRYIWGDPAKCVLPTDCPDNLSSAITMLMIMFIIFGIMIAVYFIQTGDWKLAISATIVFIVFVAMTGVVLQILSGVC